MGSHLTECATATKNKCRIVVFGSNRARLQRVATLLREASSSESHEDDVDSSSHDDDLQNAIGPTAVDIEYLPCIPIFGSYANQAGERVRYLERVDYLGVDGTQRPPGTLLSFVDESASAALYGEGDDGIDEPEDDESNAKQRKDAPKSKGSPKRPLFGPISGAAVIDGLVDEGRSSVVVDAAEFERRLRDDVHRVAAFLASILPRHCGAVPVEVMEPEPRFPTLLEELVAFRALTADEKRDASAQHVMGPGKMARFVRSLADRIVRDALEELQQRQQQLQMEAEAALSLNDTRQVVDLEPLSSSTKETEEGTGTTQVLDPTKDRYACRTCRFALFGDDDLQSPQHVPSKHHFSHKKQRGSAVQHHECQSIFLQSGRPWMDNMSDVEGKLACPKCDAKVGSWNWSGAQCSCGTWIVPAIQFPRSRVDVIPPLQQQQHDNEQQHPIVWGLPPGTVVSPVVMQPLLVGDAAGRNDLLSS
jgi:dual specificity phosphatase 12